ncbi:MAG: ABC transporter permease [Clostridia bacterium]|nr:ABC transporter permease [Clostridia bacterium]
MLKTDARCIVNDKVNRKVLKLSGVIAVVFAACLILTGIFELCVGVMEKNINFIHAGDRWSADGEPFAVITMYSEESAAVSVDQITQWAYSVDQKLLESSVTPKENARSWAYCYGAQDTLTVSGPKGQATAETLAVGGDFFVFHPLEFTYGSAFLNDNSNPMGVVLDRDLAWRVFGAENIIGMEVRIGGYDFTVVGISEKESGGEIYEYTYGERPRLYMSYLGYRKLAGDGHITIFEAALPNAVKSFAWNIFDGAVSFNEEKTAVMEASDRFSLTSRWENMKTLKYSWIRENRIEYPYWENEAKVSDYRCAILMIFEAAVAAIGVTAMLLSFILLRVSGYTLTDSIKNLVKKLPKKQKKQKKPKQPKKQKKAKAASGASIPADNMKQAR